MITTRQMIGHQAVRVDFAVKLGFPLLQRFEIKEIIVVTGKHDLSIVTTLNDVVRGMGDD